MSFITKRERVFNEYDLFDLPARNEGKLKAYASCTDARAWSHFCSDKSEHLVEVIKRNNETVRPKYLPTDVIVDTLMVAKNAEIARLKRKIEEFEQMLTAYDHLDLSCDQKCEIAHAHAAIKAANKELYELCLDLDLSGYTEGIDSEGFATGKSRGDEEPPLPAKLSKGVQNEVPGSCDVATLIRDPRISEMQETIITKDAKLNAMKNTIAVMENDICEPYCIYAHIYTALEKIFGILGQNDKYRQYLKLLTAGRDIRCIDIKGKILFKLKVLEKFCCALIAPCTQDFFSYPTPNTDECACYRVDISSRMEPTTTYALTTAESKIPNLDNKRAQLVADIIENDEMKEILSKENSSILPDDDLKEDFSVANHNYSIDIENLNRLKSLQDNYEDLISCYETLKHEKNSLEKRCKKYEEMEEELDNLKEQMREYNSLWNEKEHFRKRSANLDMLKEQYLVLTDETSNLETQLKAEGEINHIKGKAMESLRSENISLEKKLNEASIAFEKEKNGLLCQLKEADCRVMCQEQQIKSLLQQIDNLIDQDQGKPYVRDPDNNALALLDEIESSKEQIKNLRDALFCNEEEKLEFKKHYQNHLELINDLKLEIEDWKSTYEKTLQNYEALEKYNESLIEETRHLTQDLEEKTNGVDNLISVIKNKSQEINKLMQDIEKERDQNKNLHKQLNELRTRFDGSLQSLENEKLQALESLQVARHESLELLDKVKDYDEVIHKKADVTKSLELQLQDNKKLQDLLKTTIEENKTLKQDLVNQQNNNTVLMQEIHELRDVNEYAAESINNLEDQKKQYEQSLDLTLKESGELKDKIVQYENLSLELQKLQDAHKQLIEEKTRLENELLEKTFELENAIHSIQISKRESEEIIDRLQQSEGSKDSELSRISEALQKLSREKYAVQKDLMDKKRDMDNLLQVLDNLKLENEKLLQKCGQADSLEQELEDLKKAFHELSTKRNMLEANKTKELEHEIEQNRKLMKHIKYLETIQAKATNDIEDLQEEKMTTESRLNVIKKESAELLDRIKQYESLEIEYEQLKKAHHQMTLEKENLQAELSRQLADLRRMEKENSQLQSQSQNLLTHSEDLEDALIGARNELIKKSSVTSEPYQDIMDEIKAMRQEKIKNHKKIRDLRHQLEEAESIMIRLGDDVMARDSKIATLQNNINKLEEEVLRLHSSLDQVINTGEEMRDFGLEKIDTLQNIEAHHSRATHNMKMELVKLQNENDMLSDQLSVTKVKSEESSRNKYQYAAQIQLLQNEREIIVTDIKQLELESVGDTDLSPNNCDVETILTSLDRIRKSFEAKTSKSSALEHTLLQVQTSSQLLASKADEAKKIVEREKQKIISEKEDAIRDKQNMETELFNLKAKLENQLSRDKGVIEDLEATIKNKKLINDRINKSKDDYISKLEDELQTLRELYQNSVKRLSESEEKLQNMAEDKSILLETVEEIKSNLEKKSIEVAELQKQLEDLKKKSEAKITIDYENTESQTDKEELPVITNIMNTTATSTMSNTKEKILDSLYDLEEVNKLSMAKSHTQQEQKPKNPMLLNEVQILSVAVEQPFDKIRSSYVDYKMKLLSTGKLEQHSITCFTDKENEISENIATSSGSFKKIRKSGKKYANASTKGNNLIDIYNRQSMDTNSSKGNPESENIMSGKIASFSQGNSTGLKHESSETDSNTISKYKDSKTSSSGKSTDKDLFIIYKDSESSYNDNKVQSRGTWPGKGRSELIVETVTVHPAKRGISDDINHHKRNIDNKDSFVFQENEEIFEDDGNHAKHKLEINLPRIRAESYSVITTPDVDKKSLDSYSLALYPSQKQYSDSDTKFNEDVDGKTIIVSLPTISDENDQYLESFNFLSIGSDEDAVGPRMTKKSFEVNTSKQKRSQISRQKASSPSDNVSHHKLSRVGADVLLLKAERDQKNPQIEKRQNFGLEYIMDTVQGEVDPYADKFYNTKDKDLRKTRSDERFDLVKTKDTFDSSPSRLSEYKMSSTDYKTISSNSKHSVKSPQKSYIERSIMAKLDVDYEYEKKINTLSKALENLERDYKKKIEAIKMQYDSNIKSIINEHNQGVKSIQSLHEETLQGIIKLHENEVESLRSMSIEAMKKVDRLERENRSLKLKISGTACLDDEPIKMTSPEVKTRRKCRGDTRMLTKTTVEAFNVKPKTRINGPCTCSIDVNISETIRNIFDQVDVEQRKMAEHTYLKYIATKILNGCSDGSSKIDGLQFLDAQELSFLHLKVCRTWKTKLTKEEALQKKIDSLENELMNKQRNTQQHIAELDRKVAEERRRLQEVRDAVCRRNPEDSRDSTPCNDLSPSRSPAAHTNAEIDACGCRVENSNLTVGSRRSAGDLSAATPSPPPGLRIRRVREVNRATIAKLDVEERREKKLYNDEPPTRLRRSHDRHPPRVANKK